MAIAPFLVSAVAGFVFVICDCRGARAQQNAPSGVQSLLPEPAPAAADALTPLPPVGSTPEVELWPQPGNELAAPAPLDARPTPAPYVPAGPPLWSGALPPDSLPAGALAFGPTGTVPSTVDQKSLRDKVAGKLSQGLPAYAPGKFSDFGPNGQQIDPEMEGLLATYYDPTGWQFAYGMAGVQPYKFGWCSKDEFVYVPESATVGIPGYLRILEWNSTFRYAQPVGKSMVFAWAPDVNGKWYREPGGSGLPPELSQLASDVSLTSVSTTPFTWQVGFTPQINSDFRRTLTSDAYMFDARAILFWKPLPQLRFALGAAFWNRVHNYGIPYAGLIWTPDDRWEFRLLFPKSRISYYLGKYLSTDLWIYGAGEYEIQAYQIDTTDTDIKERGQWSDYQVALGVNAGRGYASAFLQCGVMLDRQVEFSGPTTDFRIKDALILRTGLVY